MKKSIILFIFLLLLISTAYADTNLSILSTVFPGKKLTLEKNEWYSMEDGQKIKINEMYRGSFTGLTTTHSEWLLVIRKAATTHMSGLDCIYFAVLSSDFSTLLSGPEYFAADVVQYHVLECINKKDSIFIATEVCYTGWCEYKSALWETGQKWTKIWEEYADSKIDVLGNKIKVYSLKTKNVKGSIAPEQIWTYWCELVWNVSDCSYEVVDKKNE